MSLFHFGSPCVVATHPIQVTLQFCEYCLRGRLGFSRDIFVSAPTSFAGLPSWKLRGLDVYEPYSNSFAVFLHYSPSWW